MKAAKARTFFGGLLRDHKLEPGDLLPSIVNAENKGTADPQGYLMAAAKAIAGRRSNALPTPATWGDDEWRTAVRFWRIDGSWSDAMGPPPGARGCRVPGHLSVEAVA